MRFNPFIINSLFNNKKVWIFKKYFFYVDIFFLQKFFIIV